jgi:hypothetical protein
VRHHSPAGARLLRRLARALRPAAVLIEGPSDFNSRLDELALPHRLPIAIYSYLRLPDGTARGAFYPFCVYSPEWQALQVARELGCPAEFIDLPWAALARDQQGSHRYADGELRRSRYIPQLCRNLGVEDFDALWDRLFEVDPRLSVEDYLKRAHQLCYYARTLDRAVPAVDVRREAFMAGRVRAALGRLGPEGGPLLVVTGGFHAYALYARLRGLPFERGAGDAEGAQGAEGAEGDGAREHEQGQGGIALTPFTYERLDGLSGYDAGMPSPGFYHAVWESRAGEGGEVSGGGEGPDRLAYRGLLERAVGEVRARGQPVSTADLIAVQALATGLAALRGHEEVWRRDVVDGISGALIKDEVVGGLVHPLLEAVYESFRGRERGALASGTALPPLVLDIRRRLEALQLQARPQERTLDLDLASPAGLERSRVLHQLRVLAIPGFERLEGTDFALRDDLSRAWERWRWRWSPSFEAGCIEAAPYGATLPEASEAVLRERALAMQRSAPAAALLLLDAALMGLMGELELAGRGGGSGEAADRRAGRGGGNGEASSRLAGQLAGVRDRLASLIRAEPDFGALTRALGHLLYLFRYDHFLGAAGAPAAGALLAEAFQRGLWLMQQLGPGTPDVDVLQGVRSILDAYLACAGPPATPGFARETVVETLQRVAADALSAPALRGACAGALWTLGEQDSAGLIAGLRASAGPARPEGMGDYLTGLFTLAREAVQRDPALLAGVDGILLGYDDDAFLEALPALRLAFSFFTPREKHYLAQTLVEAGGGEATPLPDLEVPVEVAARAMAFEARLFRSLARYGIRGGQR